MIHQSNQVETLSKVELSELFLGRTPSWRGGGNVRAVDLSSSSPLRLAFSLAVHGRNVAAVKSYWQKMIFSGRGAPPPELATEDEVLHFLRTNPNGIGYVSTATPVGEGLKEVRVQ